jgi:outer membrane assembly lipoprotein YfiO
MRILLSIISVAILVLPNSIQTEYKGVLNKLFPAKERKNAKIKKNSFPVPGVSIKDMNEEQLLLVLEYGKTRKDRDLVFKVYYHLLSVCQDHSKLKTYKLDLADYCYGLEEYEKASMKYEEFCLLYPGCNEAEYAEYKLILCTFYTSLAPHRDQTDTNRTINFIAHFLNKAKNEAFITEVQSIFKICRKRLFQHEVVVFEMNLKQKKFTGAQKRLEYLEQNFKDIEHLEKYMEYLQKVYNVCQNSKTRPFYFKIKLEDALIDEKEAAKRKVKEIDVAKTVSFFVA